MDEYSSMPEDQSAAPDQTEVSGGDTIIYEAIDYTDQFDDIIDQVTLTNQLLAGVILFLGVIFGLLLVNGLWRRFK